MEDLGLIWRRLLPQASSDLPELLPFWCTDPNCGKFHPKCQTYGHPWPQIVNIPPAGPPFAPPLVQISAIADFGRTLRATPLSLNKLFTVIDKEPTTAHYRPLLFCAILSSTNLP